MKKFQILFSTVLLFSTTLVFSQNKQKYIPLTKEEIKQIYVGNISEMLPITDFNTENGRKIMRAQSIDVNPKEKEIKTLIDRMFLSVKDLNHQGVGIAAPQVGLNRKIIVVQRFDKENFPFEAFINPKITFYSKLLRKGHEGDLSFEENGDVLRSYIIDVEYFDVDGNFKTETIEGFTAVIFQHETDHLFGTILTDRIEEQKNENLYPVKDKIELFSKVPVF